ncbi:hypothetical protein [uncultured Microscilla sp.]|uniref:hypothetical protein n=1 Tax=uncultured Microscilla sp. TaxID=432653 RepID=UPI00261309A6|nr:hypothetical protein [uncultured Microscilla sp.]
MGEKSKTIGEYGEKIANRKFLEIYGWNGVENIPFKCKNKKKHKAGKHGIDFFTFQTNHLIADTNEMLYISVKNTSSSQGLKTKFINYVSDICKAQECFVLDTQYQQITKSNKSLHQQHQIIIFWLAHDKDENFSIVDSVGEKYKDLKLNFDKIQVVDNKLANFHFLVNTFIKTYFNNINQVEYYYPNTGLNDSINGRSALAGSTLPSHFLNSRVLPYKITIKDDKKVLLLALNEAFEEDSCRRLIGLAQEITRGWCNKIVLCFPNYREQHHKSIKDSVLMDFTEKNFNRMIEIASFNLSYRDFELQQSQILSDVVNSLEDSEQSKQDFNIEKMLPYGDALRQLLTHSHIDKNDLQKILSRRGVFVNKSLNKQDLIPFLTTGFISPNEFEYLRVKHSAKASSEIITSNNIITNEEVNLTETIIDSNISIPIKDIIEKIAPNIAIDSIKNFILTDDGRLILRINTKNRKLTKDWAYSNINNHTEIVINPAQEYHGNNNTRIDVVATSTENKKIGNEVILYLEQYLQKIGVLKHDFALEKALASEFENKSRAKFLFSFFEITDRESDIIEFKDVENIHFIISENNKDIIPEDLKDLKNKVEHSLFSGHSLQDINYIKNEKYHEPLIFTEIHAKFHFKINNLEGEFDIQYGFPDLKKKEANKSEFEFKVTDIVLSQEKILSKKENHILKSSIKNEFLKVKQILLDRIDKKHGRQLKLF